MSSLSPERRIAVLVRKAWTFADTKSLDEALATMDEALAIDPALVALHRDKVEMLLRAGHPDRALEATRTGLAAVGAVPDAAELHVREGDALRRLGRGEDAIAAYAQALERDPAAGAALAQLGNALAELGRFREALARFDELCALRPRDAEASLCRGLVLAKLDRFDEGIAAIERALELDPRLMEAYLQRARALRRAGRLDAAREAAEVAMQKLPRYVEGYVIAADIALDQGDLDDAFALADKAQALDATDPHVWRVKSIGHARKGRPAAAASCRALHFLYTGQGEGALAEIASAIELDPEFVPAWHQQGVILETLGRFEEARKSYEKAVALDDRAAKALRDLGLLLVERLGQKDEGLRVLQRAIALDAKLWRSLPPELQKRVNKPSTW